MESTFRNDLATHLARFEHEQFMQLVWAVGTLQSKHWQSAMEYLDQATIPDGAVGDETMRPEFTHALFDWELETIVNERLALVDDPTTRQRSDTRSFGEIQRAVGLLREIERHETESSILDHDDFSIREQQEYKQFTFAYRPKRALYLYRCSYIYGQGTCSDAFTEKHGVSIQDFIRVGFQLHCYFLRNPALTGETEHLFPMSGVDKDLLHACLKPMTCKVKDLKKFAASERSKVDNIIYKPSVLEEFPLVDVSRDELNIFAPLPGRVFDRVSAGLFHDLADSESSMRADYEPRAREYLLDFAKTMLPELEWTSMRGSDDGKADDGKADDAVPDIICSWNDKPLCAINVIATHMPRRAIYGADSESLAGFENLVDSVKRLWRFFAECRTNHPGMFDWDKVPGLLLTFDSSLFPEDYKSRQIMGAARYELLHEMPEATESDMRRIVFAPIESMEVVLAQATPRSLQDILEQFARSRETHRGWLLNRLHAELPSFKGRAVDMSIFQSRIHGQLPWMKELRDELAATDLQRWH